MVEHLIAAVVFVGSLTALVVMAIVAVHEALDRLVYRRTISRRLRTFTDR